MYICPINAPGTLQKILASQMGAPLDFASLSRRAEISRPTLRKLIFALENVFILRLLRVEGARRGFSFFFEDIAEANHLVQEIRDPESKIAHALWMNARAALSYRIGYPHEFFQFQSRSGKMSFCIRKGTSSLGVLCIKEPSPNRAELGVTDSFLKRYRNSKVCLIHPEARILAVNPRLAILPPSLMI